MHYTKAQRAELRHLTPKGDMCTLNLLDDLDELEGKLKRAATKHRRSVLPDDFFPLSRHEEIAKGLGLNLAVEFTKFKDHHQAKGSLMLDWNAALRKWLRNAVEFKRPR